MSNTRNPDRRPGARQLPSLGVADQVRGREERRARRGQDAARLRRLGYKRDMELERYLRDAKAGWVMGPTNEVLRQFVGKAVLLGFESLDYWNQSYNRRAVENEVKKLDAAGKRELAEQLMSEASEQEPKEPAKKA